MSGKEPACQCRRHEGHGFDPWVGKIPWRRAWQPTSVHSNLVLVAQMVKNLPAMQETWVKSLGWEDPLEAGMATHSRILVWRIRLDKEPGLQSMEEQRVRHD